MTESPDRIQFARDATTGIETVRARFLGHAYDMHRHDDWLVGVTDSGAQDFFCRGTRHVSTAGRVILIEPEEAHDGQAAGMHGFAYRMLYLPRAWFKSALVAAPGGDPAFPLTLADDLKLGRAIGRACTNLIRPEARLRRDAALDAVMRLLRPYVNRPMRRTGTGWDSLVARRARDRLQACIDEDIGADALAHASGAADRFQLARAFRLAYGTSPHAYLVQVRLMQARVSLRAGEPPAAVAAACGFADQSHLGRWFCRAYGMTPAAYRTHCTCVPD